MILYAAIYRLAIGAYALALRIAALFNSKARLFVRGRKGLFSRMQAALQHEQRPRIWMHCASLGEFEQGRPVLEKLRIQYPNYAFILTFFSPSGYEVRKDYPGANYIFYLPMDGDRNAKEFLDIIQPSLALFVKYEFWYYLLKNIESRKIPTLLISAFFRKDQGFFKWYGGLQRRMLECFSHLFVQTEESKSLLATIHIDKVTVSGDTRFDRVIENAAQESPLPLTTAFCKGHKVIVAGSTWKEDEVFLEKALQRLPEHWRLIVVPHEVDKGHIHAIEKLFSGQSAKWSDGSFDNKRVLIVDKVGLLSQLYRFGTVAWIGGGFGKDGVHNVLEGAVYGIPCLYGPVFQQYVEAEQLIASGGALSVSEAKTFAAKLEEWEQDRDSFINVSVNAKSYVFSNAGATERILAFISSEKILFTA